LKSILKYLPRGCRARLISNWAYQNRTREKVKTIIIYATKYGSVEKAARILKEKLGGEVALVNLMKEKAPSFSEYDRIVLGGSVYVGKVQKELTAYINNNLPELLKRKIGLFVCAAQEPEVVKQELEAAYPQELYLHAEATAHLGYEFDFSKMSFVDKTVTKMIAKTKESKFALSEEAIANFARELAE